MNPVLKWKAGLQSAAWRPFELDGESYMVKSVTDDTGYHVALTDLVSIWFEEVNSSTFQARSKEINPKVEAPVTRLIRHVSLFVDGVQSTDCQYSLQRDAGAAEGPPTMILQLKTRLASLPYNWEFRLSQGDSNDISTHLLCPLLLTAGELQRRVQELQQLLLKKDKEITEYKIMGTRLTRRHLETSSFDEKVFDNEMVVSKGLSSLLRASPITAADAFADTYKQVMTEHQRLQQQAELDAEADGMDPLDEMMASYSQQLPASLVPGQSGSSSYTCRLPASIVPSTASGDEPAAKRAMRTPPVSPRKSARGSPIKSPVKSPVKGKSGEVESQEQELQRRLELEDRLKQQASKQKAKKKKIKL